MIWMMTAAMAGGSPLDLQVHEVAIRSGSLTASLYTEGEQTHLRRDSHAPHLKIAKRGQSFTCWSLGGKGHSKSLYADWGNWLQGLDALAQNHPNAALGSPFNDFRAYPDSTAKDCGATATSTDGEVYLTFTKNRPCDGMESCKDNFMTFHVSAEELGRMAELMHGISHFYSGNVAPFANVDLSAPLQAEAVGLRDLQF